MIYVNLEARNNFIFLIKDTTIFIIKKNYNAIKIKITTKK
jgi:hypothetical protein